MAKSFLIWFWSGGGGGNAFAVNLARRLAREYGAEAVKLSLRADDPAVTRARALGLQALSADVVSARKRPLATLARLAHARAVLSEHARGADAIIVAMNFAAAAPLSLGLRQKLIYCAHDPAPHPGDYAPLWQRTTQALLLARAARVVALSDYAAGLLRARGLAAKLAVAPLASVYEPQAPRARGPGPARLLLAGRMLAYKGLDILAAALDPIATRDDWRLTIAGHGPALDAAMIARLAHAQVERIAPGWLSEVALEALIAGHDVLLAPYRSATQSGVVAQAMAHGLPCVATPVGALPEQIGAGGWIAGAADAPAFASALTQALDSDRAEQAAAAQLLARAAWEGDHWSWLGEV